MDSIREADHRFASIIFASQGVDIDEASANKEKTVEDVYREAMEEAGHDMEALELDEMGIIFDDKL